MIDNYLKQHLYQDDEYFDTNSFNLLPAIFLNLASPPRMVSNVDEIALSYIGPSWTKNLFLFPGLSTINFGRSSSLKANVLENSGSSLTSTQLK